MVASAVPGNVMRIKIHNGPHILKKSRKRIWVYESFYESIWYYHEDTGKKCYVSPVKFHAIAERAPYEQTKRGKKKWILF